MKRWWLASLLLLALGAGAAEEFCKICRTGTHEQVATAIAAGAKVNARTKSASKKSS